MAMAIGKLIFSNYIRILKEKLLRVRIEIVGKKMPTNSAKTTLTGYPKTTHIIQITHFPNCPYRK